jgi:hypothetical protein
VSEDGMTRERPVSVLILALGSFLVAGVCLFVGVAKVGRSLLMLGLPPGPVDNSFYGMYRERTVPVPDLETYLELEVTGYAEWETAMPLGILAAGVILLAASIGLLHMRSWARWLAVLYALAVLVWQPAYVLFELQRVLPVAEIYFLDESWRTYYFLPGPTGLARTVFILFASVPAGLMMTHALLVLVVMGMPSVRGAFAGTGEGKETAKIPAEARAETAGSSV